MEEKIEILIDTPHLKAIKSYCQLNNLDFNEKCSEWINVGYLMELTNGFMVPAGYKQEPTTEQSQTSATQNEPKKQESVTTPPHQETIVNDKEQTTETKKPVKQGLTITKVK